MELDSSSSTSASTNEVLFSHQSAANRQQQALQTQNSINL